MFTFEAGFIGAGNMGGALLSAVSKQTKNISVYDRDEKKALDTGAEVMPPEKLVKNSRFVFLGVKPNVISTVCDEIRPHLSDENIVVSMAAGVTVNEISSLAGTEKVIRIMPNTPASQGAGLILYCCDTGITAEDEKAFLELMRPTGILDKLPEKLINAGMAVSGCGPAYVYMFCEALADGGVKCGLSRDKAMLYAAQTLLGGAEMLLKSGRHPGELKDAVCSPGGTTIEGVLSLEKDGFRSAVSEAVIKAFEKTAKK